ncbi:MAG: multidrug ABC transporter permease, partial [Pseudomonadota bacterium]
YSVALLPPAFQIINHFNPFFYLIDGMRFGFIGVADGPVLIGAVVCGLTAAVLWGVCHLVIRSGWRLKA